MEVYTENLIEWIQTLSPLSIYLIFGLIAYLENVVPPIPGDVLVAFGGYLAAEQIIGFSPVLAITTIASVFGFMSMYAVGAHFGDKIEVQRKKFWLMRFLDVKYFDKGKRWMDKYGQGVILANRFLAGTRSVISITAGITKTRVYTTIVSSSISSLLWNTILLGMGWFVHENWQVIGHYLNVYGWIILSLIVVFIAIRFFYKRKKKRAAEG
ncbi:MAG: DedA family protein [Balneolaceae bacterium]|nr:MAG: DedA family protein [Balneolaceae bacterium]